MSQALRNEDVTVFGDGSQTRSFTYITDLVDGIIRLMLSTENDPVNIGNPREMTIKEIAETIIRMTGSTSKIVYKPLPTDDPKQRRPDITRARTLLELGAEGAARRRAGQDDRLLPHQGQDRVGCSRLDSSAFRRDRSRVSRLRRRGRYPRGSSASPLFSANR